MITSALFAILALVGFGHVAPADNVERAGTDTAGVHLVHHGLQALTDVMVHDIFSPPQSSRGYAYALIAFYEALRYEDPSHRSYANQLNGLTAFPEPDPTQRYSWILAGIEAFGRVAEQMVFSGERLRPSLDVLSASDPIGALPDDIELRSRTFGEQIAMHVLQWASADGYARTRSAPRYTLSHSDAGAWEPTPPAYMDAVEPHWGKLRPFVLARGDQFKPAPPAPFDTTAGTPFYHEMRDVLDASRNLTDEQREIAGFWDCNPFVVHQKGHLMFGLKKITPGGHWMGITRIALTMRGAGPLEAVATYSLVAVAIADGFIASWDEKYRSNRVRPETVIRRYLDPDWQPVLQTPPFPEYTSAHSVISTAASVVLTRLFGETFAYTDDVEVAYGLPPRHFVSFAAAAREAALSRLYGGIHYPPSIERGIDQGRQIGQVVVERVRLTG